MLPQQTVYTPSMSTTSRSSSNLPSINDIHVRTERLQNGFNATYGVSGYQYSSLYNGAQIAQTEIENGHYGQRRDPQADVMAKHRQAYPNMNRSYTPGMSDFPRYTEPSYQQFRGQMPYQPPYSELDYSIHHMPGSQHPAFGVMGDSGDARKRRRGNLPKPVTDLLKQWLNDHIDHPYPTEEDKQWFIAQTGLTINQVSEQQSLALLAHSGAGN